LFLRLAYLLSRAFTAQGPNLSRLSLVVCRLWGLGSTLRSGFPRFSAGTSGSRVGSL